METIKITNLPEIINPQDDDVLIIDNGTTSKITKENLIKDKQDVLVSGVNVKTINGENILGEGDMNIMTELPIASSQTLGGVKIGSGLSIVADGKISTDMSNYYKKSETYSKSEINASLDSKQNTLVSGTNIKNINGIDILGSGDVLIRSVTEYDNAGAHNCIYRGKNLGTSVTSAQYAAIQNGTFEDLYIGDYWTINNVIYCIAAFDYYLGVGDTECTKHHVTLVPRTTMYNAQMNSSNTTVGGYVNSLMRASGLNQAKQTINSAFGTHVLNHRRILCNSVNTSGEGTGWAWYDSTVELMTQCNVYGNRTVSLGVWGDIYHSGIDCKQYPIFTFERTILSRQGYWLRDVTSASSFARVYVYGNANTGGAGDSAGVRPAFSIS